ncbi:nucleotide exchange factor GrpE [Rubrivirga sp. S365]|uniref:Protein GrpE n=1 Tax=Rubrivirga litoralis TaxID=3075598 RepID=A0ABU3BUB9_9BACT|nr:MULTISPECIES: nucleotide exchange factor GrpE [unclassified Rubrivirga]MDT0632873.1 nucleotide exchange factor GrpE [Rubrivirga sp. F394]MDT7857778.1 nucleotide exchange factor GrpE [Rubrivirga sp. S365]
MTDRPASPDAAPDGAAPPPDAPPAMTDDALPADEVDETAPSDAATDDVEALRAEVSGLQEKLLRQTAEYQNYRRRSEGDRAESVRVGRQGVLLPMLDVYDDLRRSLDAARTAAESGGAGETGALLQGIELVTKKFTDALAGVGVEPIEAVGRPFSEEEHEAVMQQPAPDAESGTVLAEVQPGYRLGDRVLRHARVVVAE